MKRLLAVLLLAGVSFAQGGARNDSAIKATSGLTGATVRVCTKAATGTPCAPTASVYTDSGLTLPAANPVAADAYGNYSYYAAPGLYKEQVSVGGATVTRIVLVGIDAGSSVTFGGAITDASGFIGPVTGSVTGNVTSTGTSTFATLAATSVNGMLNGARYASPQAALDAGGVGSRVYFPAGTYVLTAALQPYASQTIECAGTQTASPNGTVFQLSSGHAIWALQNSNAAVNLNNFSLRNCSFDLTQDSSALGALNLLAIGRGRFDNINIFLPDTGSMVGVKFDGAGDTGAYQNTVTHIIVYANTMTNTHVGFQWVNAANQNDCFNCMADRVGTAFDIQNANGLTIVGGGAMAHNVCINIANNAANSGNYIAGTRCESAIAGGQGVVIGAAAINNFVQVPLTTGYADTAHAIADASAGNNQVNVGFFNAGVYIFGGKGKDIGPAGASYAFYGPVTFGTNSASTATGGWLNLPNAKTIRWRNAANSADITGITIDANNNTALGVAPWLSLSGGSFAPAIANADIGTTAACPAATGCKVRNGNFSGALSADTSVTIGGGTAILKHISATGVLDFANTVAPACNDLTIAVTGAALGDTVAIGVPNASVVAGGFFTGFVSAADTVKVRFCAIITGDPASGTFRADVWQH